jgi:hypothetical protein
MKRAHELRLSRLVRVASVVDLSRVLQSLGVSTFGPNAPRPSDRPFVPLTLMPDRGSPGLLLKFQIVLRLLTYSGTKKGAQILLYLKDPGKQTPPP